MKDVFQINLKLGVLELEIMLVDFQLWWYSGRGPLYLFVLLIVLSFSVF